MNHSAKEVFCQQEFLYNQTKVVKKPIKKT